MHRAPRYHVSSNHVSSKVEHSSNRMLFNKQKQTASLSTLSARSPLEVPPPHSHNFAGHAPRGKRRRTTCRAKTRMA